MTVNLILIKYRPEFFHKLIKYHSVQAIILFMVVTHLNFKKELEIDEIICLLFTLYGIMPMISLGFSENWILTAGLYFLSQIYPLTMFFL